ncbi:MAG: hypothetical protein ACKOZV_15935 [Bacteroidota bacterium]
MRRTHRATSSHATPATTRDAPTARRAATPPRPPRATRAYPAVQQRNTGV